MSADEKLTVIEGVLKNAWEYTLQRREGTAVYYEGVLTCIDSILKQKGEENPQ